MVVFEIRTDKQLPYTCRQLKGGDGGYHIFMTRIQPCPSISTSSSKQYSRECHQAAVLQAIQFTAYGDIHRRGNSQHTETMAATSLPHCEVQLNALLSVVSYSELHSDR